MWTMPQKLSWGKEHQKLRYALTRELAEPQAGRVSQKLRTVQRLT